MSAYMVRAGYHFTQGRYSRVPATGESEYWFAMIKVVMIIVFIFVGLIYDWGGIRGHPGPVRSNSTLPFSHA